MIADALQAAANKNQIQVAAQLIRILRHALDGHALRRRVARLMPFDPVSGLMTQTMFWEILGLAVRRGQRNRDFFSVLLIDFDPQGNASTGLGVERSARDRSVYQVLVGDCRLEDAVITTQVPRLDVVAATQDLAAAEVELSDLADRTTRLDRAIGSLEARWDVCLIDCPPSLGLLTINALVAARSLLIPLQCEFFALEGLSQLLQTVERVRARFNPTLSILGVALTMYDRRNRLSEQVADDVRAVVGDLVFKTVVPRNVRLSEAPSHGLPALVYDHRCPGSEIGRLPAPAAAA